MAALVTFNATDIQNDIRTLMQSYTDLPIGLRNRQIKSAMGKAMRPWMPEFRKVAPKRTGGLRKSVMTVTKFDRRAANFYAAVGYGRSKTKKGHHAIIVHDGTKERQKKSGQRTGRVEATRFASGLAARIRSTGNKDFLMHLEAALENGIKQLERYNAARTKSGRRYG